MYKFNVDMKKNEDRLEIMEIEFLNSVEREREF